MSADLDDVPVELRPAVAAALDAAGVTDGHLSLELVDTDRIHELNRDHRGKDEPTDVLSFPIDGTGPNRSRAASTVISSTSWMLWPLYRISSVSRL